MSETTTKPAAMLDRIDQRILSELQLDARLSVAEIARRVHLSVTPCVKRMDRLEREGIITGYSAQVDSRRLGYDLLAFIEVSLDRTNPDSFNRFREAIAQYDEVTECYMIAGKFDYLLKVHVISSSAFREFLVEKLTKVEGLNQTHTSFALEEIKRCSTLRMPPIDDFRRRRGVRVTKRSRSPKHPRRGGR